MSCIMGYTACSFQAIVIYINFNLHIVIVSKNDKTNIQDIEKLFVVITTTTCT